MQLQEGMLPQTKPVSPAEESTFPFSPAALSWFLLLLILCYAPILVRLVNQWATDEDMGHGFFVPIVAGYIAWQKREQLRQAQLVGSSTGYFFLAIGAALSILGTLAAELFTTRIAFLSSILGCVLVLGGWKAVRILLFPLFLLLFMVPIPAILYNRITFPLQLIASQVAEVVLEILGVPVLREGNVLELPSQKLSVVEACSGIRSLLSLSFLSLVYGYFFDSRVWMRGVLFVLTGPIAIVANACRVTLTGLLSEVNPEYARGVYHSMSGWAVFVVAFVMLFVTHKFVDLVSRTVQAPATAPHA
ncbi:MAG: exosortase/archaeosortase family protein [Bryobacteraceae bacterium]|nr:exosortase/archaeosortase family protein [Bryobacteraceae bacterium]MDW8380374.1 exosortase/archaeosortase family protein [Bryobacterales bacterium]